MVLGGHHDGHGPHAGQGGSVYWHDVRAWGLWLRPLSPLCRAAVGIEDHGSVMVMVAVCVIWCAAGIVSGQPV